MFVSLGGAGYAAATIGSAEIENNSVRSKDLKNRTILRKDVNRKTIASLRGQKGEPGQPGPAGPPGSALAFAHVNADGSVDAAASTGVVVLSATQGRYCLDITTPTAPRNVAATITWSGEAATAGQGITATVEPEGVAAACPASPSSDAFVETDEGPLESSAPDAKPFYVVFN